MQITNSAERSRRPGPLRWAVSALFLAFLCLTQTAECQLFGGNGLFNRKTEAPRAQTEDEIGVPVPVTGRVEALKGHEVQFEVRAESKTPGASVEFLIRSFPSAGRIVSIVSKPNERNKALVTYYADPESSATTDAFSFAVRYRGGRYSSEMRFDIDLNDLKIEIQAPPEVDYGEVLIGSEAIQEILVRNIGNGSAERQIFLAPPWHLIDPADGLLNIGPRGGRVLKVAFRPELTGETSYLLSFSRSKEGTTKLVGIGGDPFQLASEAIELILDEASGERRGEIELMNPGTKSLLLEARASTRLQQSLRESYLLAPGKSTKVVVHLGATDTAPFDGTVEFFLKNGYAKSTRVISPVVPAKLVVTVPNALSAEVINFGKVEAGRSMERGMTVTNRGGVSVPLEFHLPEPFRILTNPGLQLAPLASVQISVGMFPAVSQRGLVDVTMNIHGNEQTVPIRLLGNVVPPTGAPTGSSGALIAPNLPSNSMRMSSSGTGASDSASTVEKNRITNGGVTPDSPERAKESADPPFVVGSSDPSMGERIVDPALREPEDLSVLEEGSDSIMLGWTAPKEPVESSFRVERRTVAEEAGKWSVVPAVKYDRIERLVKAQINRLEPETGYEFRIRTVTDDGRSSLPSEVLAARTVSPEPWLYRFGYPALAGLFVFLVLVLGVFLLLRRRPRPKLPPPLPLG